MSTWEIVLWSAVLVVAAVWPLYRLVVAARTYFRFRGERLVICPETNDTFTALALSRDSTDTRRSALSSSPRLKPFLFKMQVSTLSSLASYSIICRSK